MQFSSNQVVTNYFMIEWLLYRVLVVIVGWYIWWYLVYLLTGFHLWTVGISNGFKINGVSYQIKHGKVYIGSIRYRGWGKLGLIILEDVKVIYNHQKSKYCQNDDNPSLYDDNPSLHDNNIPISIYPKNKIIRSLIHYIILHIPAVSFEFRQSNFLINNITFDIQYIRFAIQSKLKHHHTIKITWDFIINNLSSSLHINLINLKLNSKFLIDSNNGQISKIRLKCFSDEFQVSLFQLTKQLLHNIDINGFGLVTGKQTFQNANTEDTSKHDPIAPDISNGSMKNDLNTTLKQNEVDSCDSKLNLIINGSRTNSLEDRLKRPDHTQSNINSKIGENGMNKHEMIEDKIVEDTVEDLIKLRNCQNLNGYDKSDSHEKEDETEKNRNNNEIGLHDNDSTLTENDFESSNGSVYTESKLNNSSANKNKRVLNNGSFQIDESDTHIFESKVLPLKIQTIKIENDQIDDFNKPKRQNNDATLFENLMNMPFLFFRSIYCFFKNRKEKSSGIPVSPAPPSTPMDQFTKLVNFHNKVYSLIDTFSLHLENTVVKDIPFITIKQSVPINQYFQEKSPKSYLNLKMTSFSFNISKMNNRNTGFNILFDSNDQPFHLTSNLQLLTVDYIISGCGNDIGINREILNIPNFAITFKSNIGYNLSRGHGFKDSVIELFASTSSPIVDLNTTQLSEICFNMILIMKYQYLKKLINNDVRSNKSNSTFDIIKTNFINLLKKNYPRLDTRIIVEQPRFLIHQESSSAIFNVTYDLLDFQIFTTKNWQYHSKCTIINSTISIYEHTVSKHEIFCSNSVTFNFNLLADLKFKGNLTMDAITINLSELATLSLINDFLSDIKQRAHDLQDKGIKNILFNSMIDEYLRKPNHVSQTTNSKPEAIFKPLPLWFLSFEIGINSFELYLGSRSILIPKNHLFKTDGPELQDFKGENQELRNVKVSYNNLSVVFVNKIEDDSKNLSLNKNTSEDLLPQSFTSLETLSEDVSDNFWKLAIKISNFDISVQTRLSDIGRHGSFISLPGIDLNLSSLMTKKLKVDFLVGELVGNYDRYKLFILVGAFHMMNHIIVSPIKKMIKKFKNEHSKEPAIKTNVNKPRPLDIFHLVFTIDKVNLLLKIGNDFNLKIQLKLLIATINESKAHILIEATRILTESPVVNQEWTRLLYVDSLKLETSLKDLNEPAIYINSNLITFFHPHQFVVYKLFDNLSVTIKTLKYFISVISHHDEMEKVSQEIFPKILKPLKMPFMNIKSNQLSFRMEDDPFESQLNMIYQLGIVEQRKRLELMSLFELKIASEALGKEQIYDIDIKLYSLRENMSKSWIRKVKLYKEKLKREIVANKKYLFGNETTLDKLWNKNVTPHSIFAPLLMIQMDNFDLQLSKPDFDLKNLPQYLNKIGQGIPEDTKYSLLIPTFIKWKLSQLRMHLRDYPLPFVHVPRPNKEEDGIIIKGNFVLAEQFCDSKEQMRHLHVPFVPGPEDSVQTKYYSLELNQSLSSVKIFTDSKLDFNTDYPSRFVIGCSYQFAIQQVMLNFDQFSKPPVDQSPKLGVWDKLRLIMHGNFIINVKKNLEVAFKGSRDPYNLFTTSSGFVLSFMDNIVWTINENDDSKDFINVTSDRVSWYMPNYLGSPLPCWTRDTSKSAYLPKSTSFITSLFGYYLDEGAEPSRSLEKESLDVVDRIVIQLSGGVHFKVGFLLQRDDIHGDRCSKSVPHYEVKSFNPVYVSEGHDSYAGFRSDYLSMLISLKANKETNYNTIHLNTSTFKVFFEWWKLFDSSMMLPIRKSKMFGQKSASPKFSKHLLNNVFEFHIKSLFVAHTFRNDTFDTGDIDFVECYGVRGKMEEFIVDIHQKREPKKFRHEGLSKAKQVNKMAFQNGEIHLTGIDLRVIKAKFYQDIYGNRTNKKSKQEFETFDNDKQWFDMNDYGESGAPSLFDTPGKICIYPLLYSEKFSYIRDTNSDEHIDEALKILGSESIHDCTIFSKNHYNAQVKLVKERISQLKQARRQSESEISAVEGNSTEDVKEKISTLNSDLEKLEKKSSRVEEKLKENPKLSIKEDFNNKFTLISTFIKWNKNSRDTTLRYINQVHLNGLLKNFISYESINVVEEMIQNRTINDDISTLSTGACVRRSRSKSYCNTDYSSSQDRLDNFDSVLRKIYDFQSISNDYMVEIINPQIQLQGDFDKNSVIIIAAPSIDSKILSVYDKSDHEQYANSKVLETRSGWVIKDASIFVLKNNTADKSELIVIDKAYGSESNWPPFLGVEVCRNGRLAGTSRLLVEKLAVMVTYDQLSPLGLVANQGNDVELNNSKNNERSTLDLPSNILHVDIPQLIVTSTSNQYSVLYEIIIGLLFYSAPASKMEKNQLQKLKFSINFHDLSLLKDRLEILLSYHGTLKVLARNYHFRLNGLNNENLNDYIFIKSELSKTMNEIYLLMMSILKGENYAEGSSSNLKDNWFICADKVTLHLLEDDRTPLIDVGFVNGRYKRSLYEDGSNKNRIAIELMEVFNLLENTKYTQTLGPCREILSPDVDLLIKVNWNLNRTVGGIKIIENLEVFLEPLIVQLDEDIVNKLLEFAFKADLDNLQEIRLPHTEDTKDDDNSSIAGSKLYKNDKGSESQLSVTFKSKKSGSSGSEDIKNIHDDDVDRMITRSKQYVSIVQLYLHSFKLNISIDLNKGYKRMLNVQDFLLEMDPIIIENKILSVMEFGHILKSAIIKTLLGHSGRLIKNKFLVKKRKSQKFVNQLTTFKSSNSGKKSKLDHKTSKITL